MPRSRLSGLLDAAADRTVTLVSAPAGAGKTLMLADWLSRAEVAHTWLTVEPEDADPLHFWSHLLFALQSRSPESADGRLALLRPPGVFDRRFVAALLEAVRSSGAAQVVVLDDVHLLRGSATMATLADLLQRRRGPLRLVLATRAALALPLERLRLEGNLADIGTDDLAFRPEEAASMLALAGVRLTPEEFGAVLAKTEGWAVGLRLAAFALEHSTDVSRSVAGLMGDQRIAGDYFVQEVLARLPAAVRQFLVDTSVVRQVSAGLADSVTGRSDAATMLVRLERENLFLVGLDEQRSWFRYHHMFADLLRQRFAMEETSHRRVIHLRAAAWYAGNGQQVEAGRQLAAAEEWDALATHLVRVLGPYVLGHQRQSVLQLAGLLPPEVVTKTADGAMAAALVDYAHHDPVAMRAHIDRAGCALGLVHDREREITSAVIAVGLAIAPWMDGRVAVQIEQARAAVEALERITVQELPALKAYRASAATILALGLLWSGDLDRADSLFARLVPAVADTADRAPVLGVHLHGSWAVLKAFQGRLRQADDAARTALDAAVTAGWRSVPQSAAALLARAIIHLQRAEWSACDEAVKRGQGCLQDETDVHLQVGLALVRIRLELSGNRTAAARAVMQALQREIDDEELPAVLRRWRLLVSAEVELAGGQPDQAGERLSELEPPHGHSARSRDSWTTLRARIALHERQPRECARLLEELRTEGGADLVLTTEAWLLSAIAFYRLRLESDARHALHRALEVSADDRIARPFLTSGRPATALLRHYLEVETRQAAWGNVLLALLEGGEEDAVPKVRLLEPLTNRERGVLALLPTMMNNSEIAEELFLSVNTIKVHLKSLYRKLGVNNRRQAVRVGRQLGLGEVAPSYEPDGDTSARGA